MKVLENMEEEEETEAEAVGKTVQKPSRCFLKQKPKWH